MPTAIRLEFYGDEQLNRTLVDIERATEDLRPVFHELADRFVDLERRQFLTEGGFASGGWPALSPKYAKWKAKAYPGKTILRRTDALYDSLTERPLGVEVIEPQRIVLGSDVEYGAYHQNADGQKRRRPVEFPESERREWVKRIQRYIVTGGLSS